MSPTRLPTCPSCCRCILPSLPTSPAARFDNCLGTPQETRMLQLCLRLLSSRLAAGSIVDEIIVTEKLKKQASLQKDSRASLQLQDYLGRLKQKHVLNRRLQVLCVLANLSFSPDSSSASYVQHPAHLRSCLTRVFPCAGTSRSRFQRCLPLHSDWMSLSLLLSLYHQHLVLARIKMRLLTPCPKLLFCAIASLLCTASTARCRLAQNTTPVALALAPTQAPTRTAGH